MCGRIITNGNDLCRACVKKDTTEEFKIIREFLYSNPGANINKIVEKTGVEPSKVLQYIRDGRLDILV
jgi:hypothetical protein